MNPDWLAAGALRLFGEKASVSGLNPATGRSAITSDDVDLSADDWAPSGSRLRLRCDKNGNGRYQRL
jgi:hypothetical protein